MTYNVFGGTLTLLYLSILLCAEVVRQGVPDHGALHSEIRMLGGQQWIADVVASVGWQRSAVIVLSVGRCQNVVSILSH